jgi:hypothetical protein
MKILAANLSSKTGFIKKVQKLITKGCNYLTGHIISLDENLERLFLLLNDCFYQICHTGKGKSENTLLEKNILR